MLPQGSIENDTEIARHADLPSKTYQLDFKKGCCIRTIDNLTAMEQAIFKILETNRFEKLIYGDDYGFEALIGKDETFVRAETKRRVTEALLQDDRITAVENIQMVFDMDEVLVSFDCVTIHGTVNMAKAVKK